MWAVRWVSWKDKDFGEYKTRIEGHRVVWEKFGEWAGSLKKGAAEIHAISILTLDRAEKTKHEGETAAAELSGNDDTRF